MSTRRHLTRVGLIGAAAWVAAATSWALLQALAAPESQQRVALAGPVHGVEIAVGQGDVEVRTHRAARRTAADTRVRSIVAPRRVAELAGGVARLSWDCRLWTTCRADVTARVPAGVALRARTQFGNIVAAGPLGDIDLATGSGDVEARRVDGDRARVRARSGGAVLQFDTPPSDVEVRVTSGDVEITLPAGTYRIAASTRSGRVRLQGLVDDPRSRRSIVADTTAGDILIRTG